MKDGKRKVTNLSSKSKNKETVKDEKQRTKEDKEANKPVRHRDRKSSPSRSDRTPRRYHSRHHDYASYKHKALSHSLI